MGSQQWILGFCVFFFVTAQSHEVTTPPVYIKSTTKPTPWPVQTLHSKALQEKGATSVSDALRVQPGIQLRDSSGTDQRPEISLRGFGGNAVSNTLIIIDGLPYNENDLSSPLFNHLNLSDIASIEIIPSSASVLYGEEAVGGVVAIRTKPVQAKPPRIKGGIGSHGLHLEEAELNEPLGKLLVRARFTNEAGEFYRDRNDAHVQHGTVRADYHHAHGMGNVQMHHAAETFQLPGALSQAELRQNRRWAQKQHDDTQREASFFNWAHEHMTSNGTRAMIQTAVRSQDLLSHFDAMQVDQTKDALHIAPRLQRQFSSGLLETGMALEGYRYRLASPFGEADDTSIKTSIFGNWQAPLRDTLDYSIGARATRILLTEDESHTALTPGVGLIWRADDNGFFSLHIAKSVRFPKLDELTLLAEQQSLKPQTGLSIDFSTQWQWDKVRLYSSFFNLDLKNEIDFDPNAQNQFGFPGANRNLEPTRRRGALLALEFPITPIFSLTTNYTFADARFRSGPFAGNRVPFVAEHVFYSQLLAKVTPALNLYVGAEVMSERNLIGDFEADLPPLGGQTLYHTGANWQVNKALKLALSVKNVTGKEYVELGTVSFGTAAFYPAPERTWQLQAEYAFDAI